MKNGLCRMARNNIHMALGLPQQDSVISGMRNSCQIVVELNITRAVFDKIPHFISQNQVILTPGVGDSGLLPPQYFRSIYDLASGEFLHQQKFKYLCVYDLEANCSKVRGECKYLETVELPVVIIDTETQKIVGEFQTYVRPELEKLNPFTTELTGITEDQVFGENVPTFEQALLSLHTHLEKFGIFSHEFILLSCGDYDGNQLNREAKVKNIPLPNYL
jgi:hypothetical protein